MALFLPQMGFPEFEAAEKAILNLAEAHPSLEGFAQALVAYLHESLLADSGGDRATVLVRCFATARAEELPDALQPKVQGLPEDAHCLVLLGSRGLEPAWCDRRLSKDHQVIPLVDEATAARAIMMAKMLTDLGVTPHLPLAPDPDLVRGADRHPHRVFFVPHALGSAYIPAQEGFIRPFGVRSVVGFGGMAGGPRGLAVILFTRVELSEEVAGLFRFLSLALKQSLTRLEGARLFDAS